MNKVFLIGRLTKDAEVRVTQTGKKVASFSIAVNDGKNSQGQELVQYFNLSAWEKTAEIIELYVKKGTKVAVFGRLQNRSWDKADGTKGYATDILVSELEILSSKAEGEAYTAQNPTTNETTKPASSKSENKKAKDDELPEIDVESLNVQMPF